MPADKIAVADQLDAGPGLPNIGDQLLVARPVEHHHDQVVHAAMQAAGDVPQVVGDRSVQFDRVLARRPDDDLLHVAVGGMQQAAFLGRSEHGNRSGRAGGAQVGAFERIDGNIDAGNLPSVGKGAAHLLADVEHGRFVAFALADHDGAAHRDGVHGLAHGLGGDLIAQRTVSLAHGARRGDGRFFDDAQKFQRQIAFDVLAKTLGMRFRTSLGWHECLLIKMRLGNISPSAHEGKGAEGAPSSCARVPRAPLCTLW